MKGMAFNYSAKVRLVTHQRQILLRTRGYDDRFLSAVRCAWMRKNSGSEGHWSAKRAQNLIAMCPIGDPSSERTLGIPLNQFPPDFRVDENHYLQGQLEISE